MTENSLLLIGHELGSRQRVQLAELPICCLTLLGGAQIRKDPQFEPRWQRGISAKRNMGWLAYRKTIFRSRGCAISPHRSVKVLSSSLAGSIAYRKTIFRLGGGWKSTQVRGGPQFEPRWKNRISIKNRLVDLP